MEDAEAEAALLVLGSSLTWTTGNKFYCNRAFVEGGSYGIHKVRRGVFRYMYSANGPEFGAMCLRACHDLPAAKVACERHHATGKWEYLPVATVASISSDTTMQWRDEKELEESFCYVNTGLYLVQWKAGLWPRRYVAHFSHNGAYDWKSERTHEMRRFRSLTMAKLACERHAAVGRWK